MNKTNKIKQVKKKLKKNTQQETNFIIMNIKYVPIFQMFTFSE